MVFLFFYVIKLNIFGFGQSEQFEYVYLGFGKL